MAVVVMFHAVANRNHASMRHLAFHMLELDGGVVDVKVMMQSVLHITKNALADRGRNVGNRDMAGKSMGF